MIALPLRAMDHRCVCLLLTLVIGSVIAIGPGARVGAALWVDNNDVLWLFGGLGYEQNATFAGYLNDLWYYTNDTWYWVPTKKPSRDQIGIYGTQGVAAAENRPGARVAPANWIDQNGNLWLFGGLGVDVVGDYSGGLNDMWMFNVTSWQWMWVRGQNTRERPGIPGYKMGEYSDLYTPSSRYYAAFTTDDQGNFLLFGGYSYLTPSANDLWSFRPTTGEWAWIAGDPSAVSPKGYYGDMTIEGPLNVPSGRIAAAMWYQNSCVYLFGGYGYSNNTIDSLDILADMWRYNTTSAQWTWLAGIPNYMQHSVYGPPGQPSVQSVPGARQFPQYWLDDAALLYMFAGEGVTGFGSYMSDLWAYNTSSALWTWFEGNDQGVAYPVFTAPGTAGNSIGSLSGAATYHRLGKTYLYGGQGFIDEIGNKGYYAALWYRDAGTDWQWLSGPALPDAHTEYPLLAAPVTQSPTAGNVPVTSGTPVVIPPSQPPSLTQPLEQVNPPTDPPVNVVTIAVTTTVIPVSVGAALFVLLFLLKRKRAQQRSNEHSGSMEELAKYEAVPLKPEHVPSNMQLIPRSAIELIKEIGAGSFGKVFKAKYRGSDVAVKISNMNTSTADFIKEASFQMNIPPHPNIVQFFGICMDDINVLVVLEFCHKGSLDKVLFEGLEMITEVEQLHMATQISRGLCHLHENNIVHRDLAARNVLIHATGELKISDFGMSRKLEQEDVGKTANQVGPIRWMAPESIQSLEYSKKSDVWTFGMVLYEIVARQEPHSQMAILDVGVRIRDEGFTPTIPESCPNILAEVMQMCWQRDPKDRPVCTASFTDRKH